MKLRSASLFLLSAAVLLLLPSSANSQTGDQIFNSNGVKIRYIVVRKGEPVILVHGFAGNLGMSDPLIDDLANDHEVIALDCRGHGKSDTPHQPELYGSLQFSTVEKQPKVELPDRNCFSPMPGANGAHA